LSFAQSASIYEESAALLKLHERLGYFLFIDLTNLMILVWHGDQSSMIC